LILLLLRLCDLRKTFEFWNFGCWCWWIERAFLFFVFGVAAAFAAYKGGCLCVRFVMGISMVVTVPSTLVLAAYVACRDSVPPYISYPLLQASLVGFAAAVSAYPAVNYTALFGKTSEGSFPWWSYTAFYPYLLTLRGYVILRRLKSKEPVYTEIKNGLFVGGWPWLQADVPPGSPAVVDCTCELPRSSSALPLPYLCIPTWDTRGPRPSDIELAVRWAVKRRSQNLPVYVHCAFGKFDSSFFFLSSPLFGAVYGKGRYLLVL
jgi:hypothetical protein